MKKILCPECKCDEIEAKYTVYMYVNDMAIEEDEDSSYRYCESTDHYLDGDFSDHLLCLQCNHVWEEEGWQHIDKEKPDRKETLMKEPENE